MPVATAPIVDGRFRPSQARPPCLTPHPPVTFAGSRPIEREPQKLKGSRTSPALLCLWRTPKGQQSCFVRLEGQSEAPQAFIEYCHHTPCVLLTFKADDEVITIAHQGRFALKPWLHLGLKPQVEHIMQVDVTQQRREH